jgi:hypothetical protein
LNITKEQALAILKKISGPPRRELVGEEHDHMWLVLNLLLPIRSSNNQRTHTDEYRINGVDYHVHYGLHEDGSPMIEEIGDFDS